MSLRYESGDFLDARVEAVVNTVNTRGVMGKGIALQVKQRWPEVDRVYRAASKRGEVTLGRMHVVERGGLGDGPSLVINFPTKDHWKSKSKLADVVAGLEDLKSVIDRLGIKSIAVPPLGCGNGGLEWADVRPLIESALGDLGAVDVIVFAPAGAPAAAGMHVGTTRPNMTATLAGLITALSHYWTDPLGITDIEVQKLAYFLGAQRQDLRLRFAPGSYGPYCEALHHVLQRAEGHYLRGYGDRSRRPWEAEVLSVLPEGIDAAEAFVAATPGFAGEIQAVDEIAFGYEGPWGMELLATVHWVASDADPARDPEEARKRIASWSARKNKLFPATEVEGAWKHLESQGWLEPATAPVLFDA